MHDIINNSLPIVDTLSNAFRDPNSGAVIINDPDGFDAAKKRKQLNQRQERNEQDIADLKKRMARVDDNLDRLVNLLT